MNTNNHTLLNHLQAILTSVVWGTTFVSSKVLINHDMTPAEILLFRFAIAYLCILPLSHHTLWCKNWKDELWMVALGMAGGSVYFLAENTALEYTQACNVSILISVTPLLTALATPLFFRGEKLSKSVYWGAPVALIGVACVVLNGHFILKLSPLGDILTICASLIWVGYGIILKKLQTHEYSSLFITRKVFFYGVITILPVIALSGHHLTLATFTDGAVIGNLIYLAVIASFLGYLAWNYVVDKIGVVTTTNYLYLNPLATFITSAIVLHENITMIAIIGGLLILSGVYLSQKKETH
jgi:drug/metabolite transporter (DMT)-like permease